MRCRRICSAPPVPLEETAAFPPHPLRSAQHLLLEEKAWGAGRTCGAIPAVLPKPSGEMAVRAIAEARRRSSPEWFPASSLVCFCITCQAFFLSARKPASAPCAARISRTAQPPSRTRPQTRTRPHRVRRSPARTPTHPAANAHKAAPATPAAKQVFHNLSTEFSTILPIFHNGFLSPWLSLRETG